MTNTRKSLGLVIGSKVLFKGDDTVYTITGFRPWLQVADPTGETWGKTIADIDRARTAGVR